jgi:hypothetical protein
MQYKTHNQKYVRIDGTSLQGYITTDYAKLKKAFGMPNSGDEYKIDAEWDIEFPDGLIATVYNWKDGKAYLGADGTPKTKITTWHIGGKNQQAVDRIITVLEALK